MATIVTQYDPWREKLAAGLGVNLLSDAIQRSQAADMNRKYNSLYSTVMDAFNGGQNVQTNTNVNLLSGQSMLEGYNDNGWAKALHENYTPFTQFDMGTQSLMGQQVNRATPTPQDIITALGEQIGTPRYNMLNMKDALTMFEPAMKLAEQARAEQRAKNVMSAYGNAETPQEQFNVLFTGLGNRDIGDNVVSAWNRNYEFNNPNNVPVQINAGDETKLGGFNPRTSEFNITGSVPIRLSPMQEAEIDLHSRGYDIQEQNNDRNYALANDELDAKIRRDNWEKERVQEAANNTASKMTVGEQYYYNRLNADKKTLEKKLEKNGKQLKNLQAIMNDPVSLPEEREIAEINFEKLAEENKSIQSELDSIESKQEALEQKYMNNAGGSTQVEQHGDMLPPVAERYRPKGDSPQTSEAPITSSVTPLGNIVSGDVTSDDIRPQVAQQGQLNAMQYPLIRPIEGSNTPSTKQNRIIYQVQENGKTVNYEIPSEVIYDKVRDAHVDPNMVYGEEQFYRLVNNFKRQHPEWTVYDIIKSFYRQGFKLNFN